MLIKRRLHEHFEKHFEKVEKQKRGIISVGIGFCAVGVILMIITAFLFSGAYEKSIFISFLVILLEPASWFLFWEGLNQTIFEAKKINPILRFHEKRVFCQIKFLSY